MILEWSGCQYHANRKMACHSGRKEGICLRDSVPKPQSFALRPDPVQPRAPVTFSHR
jgi:hypothetical protein